MEMPTATITDIIFKNKEMIIQCPIWLLIFFTTTRLLFNILTVSSLTINILLLPVINTCFKHLFWGRSGYVCFNH